MNKNYLRAYCERGAEVGKAGDPIKFVASTEGIKRDGKELVASRWDLSNYLKNPVFLWAHDYMGRNLPIGRTEPEIEGKQLVTVTYFDQADEFARQVEAKYRAGYLNAVSVGWFEVYHCKKCGERLDFWDTWGLTTFRKKCPHCHEEITEKDVEVKYDLLDISGVPVPGDPEALMEREVRALEEIVGNYREEKSQAAAGERPYPNEHSCRLKDPGDFEKDSFRRVEREHEGKKYGVIMGKLKGETTMTEQAYRYPKSEWSAKEARAHCKDHEGKSFEEATGEEMSEEDNRMGGRPFRMMDGSEGIWRGVASAMLSLYLQPMAMEEPERKNIYILLERAYRKLGKVAPEYRTQGYLVGLGCEEIEGMFLEDEVGGRGAIPPHTTEKADEDTSWDGPGEVAKCAAEEKALRRMHAWVDSEKDPDTKQAYKLPHHLASGPVVWRGVAAAMQRLLGRMVKIPEDDRRGVYAHLARHYKQIDKKVPEFRSLAEEARLNARNKANLNEAVRLINGVLASTEEDEEQEEGMERDNRPIEREEREILEAINLRLKVIEGK
jgi:hypothetical protein